MARTIAIILIALLLAGVAWWIWRSVSQYWTGLRGWIEPRSSRPSDGDGSDGPQSTPTSGWRVTRKVDGDKLIIAVEHPRAGIHRRWEIDSTRADAGERADVASRDAQALVGELNID